MFLSCFLQLNYYYQFIFRYSIQLQSRFEVSRFAMHPLVIV